MVYRAKILNVLGLNPSTYKRFITLGGEKAMSSTHVWIFDCNGNGDNKNERDKRLKSKSKKKKKRGTKFNYFDLVLIFNLGSISHLF